MQVSIQPSKIGGTITAPASKSSMQRACAAAFLHSGTTIIKNPGKSNDDLAALDIIQGMGAEVKNDNAQLIINSNQSNPRLNEINCGESGLSIRMFTALAAIDKKPILINGTGSLLNRPMDFFDQVFPLLGIKIHSQNGKLPIQIEGPLVPTEITIDGSLSSQFLTGLLMAYAKTVTKPTIIHVTDLKSKPYIDLTLKVLADFDFKVTHEEYKKFTIFPVNTTNRTIEYTVEGDWSGASFLLVAGALAGNSTVKGLDLSSTQADKAIIEALQKAGAKILIEQAQITVGTGNLKAFEFDATDCPDLFPPLVALACYCTGNSLIKGVSRLSHKESNRALSLQESFGKLGIVIHIAGDNMVIEGNGIVKGNTAHSFHDHRIAMALSIAALKADAPVVIEAAEAINKSYPHFYEDLKMMGATVSLPIKQ